MELFDRFEGPSNLGSCHWGHIIVVVEDIFNLKFNTPHDQLNKMGGELKPWGKHDAWN